MAVNVAAVVLLVIFYLAIMAIGLIAAWKVKINSGTSNSLDASIVAGRNLTTVVGIFTMIATTVGGGYINGTAESVARDGLIWTLAPFGIFIGLNIGGLAYAIPMRSKQYVTMLDPFQSQYGAVVVVLIYLASLLGDLLWTASILNALGTTLSVIADIPISAAVLASGVVTLTYTVVGTMIAVAYTDILQLLFIVLGLGVSCPFVLMSDHMGSLETSKDTWLGTLDVNMAGVWTDLLIAMTLGTIPWQAYFQRVLSVRSARQAQVLSFVAALGAVVLVVPSVLIGMAGTSLDWNVTSLGVSPMTLNQSSLVLPLVINEFSPPAVSILALGAISAAVMSSMDSSVLATSSMFSHNIYNTIFRTRASNRELRIVQVLSILFFGGVAMAIALLSTVIYELFILAADMVFVIIFPQLTAVLYCPRFTNTAGAVVGYVIGLLLRIGAGESLDVLPTWIYYPYYDEDIGQLFPYRTFAMIVSFVTILVVSYVWDLVQRKVCTGSWRPDQCEKMSELDSEVKYVSRFGHNKREVGKHQKGVEMGTLVSKDI